MYFFLSRFLTLERNMRTKKQKQLAKSRREEALNRADYRRQSLQPKDGVQLTMEIGEDDEEAAQSFDIRISKTPVGPWWRK
jgi:hypothetical protein